MQRQRVEDPSSDDSSEEEQAGLSAETPAAACSAADQRRPCKQTKRLYDEEAAGAKLSSRDSKYRAQSQANTNALLQQAFSAQEDVRTLVFGFAQGGAPTAAGSRSILLMPQRPEKAEVLEKEVESLVTKLRGSGWVDQVMALLQGTEYWQARVRDLHPVTIACIDPLALVPSLALTSVDTMLVRSIVSAGQTWLCPLSTASSQVGRLQRPWCLAWIRAMEAAHV